MPNERRTKAPSGCLTESELALSAFCSRFSRRSSGETRFDTSSLHSRELLAMKSYYDNCFSDLDTIGLVAMALLCAKEVYQQRV